MTGKGSKQRPTNADAFGTNFDNIFRKKTMSTVQIQFKDPDVIWEIINAKHPLPDDEDDVTPRMEKAREDFSDDYFEYGDYGMIEIDTETLACRLLPRKEWK